MATPALRRLLPLAQRHSWGVVCQGNTSWRHIAAATWSSSGPAPPPNGERHGSGSDSWLSHDAMSRLLGFAAPQATTTSKELHAHTPIVSTGASTTSSVGETTASKSLRDLNDLERVLQQFSTYSWAAQGDSTLLSLQTDKSRFSLWPLTVLVLATMLLMLP